MSNCAHYVFETVQPAAETRYIGEKWKFSSSCARRRTYLVSLRTLHYSFGKNSSCKPKMGSKHRVRSCWPQYSRLEKLWRNFQKVTSHSTLSAPKKRAIRLELQSLQKRSPARKQPSLNATQAPWVRICHHLICDLSFLAVAFRINFRTWGENYR
jgi:hypothetical protein